MGIIGEIKQISASTLELLKGDPLLVEVFRDAEYLPEYALWQRVTYWKGYEKIKQEVRARFGKLSKTQGLSRFIPGNRKQWKKTYDWQALEQQFLGEWENPALDLHKSWQELTFLLAGYIPGYYATPQGKIPELIVDKGYKKDFLPFLVVENSAWDGMPLVNAFGAGTEIGYETGYGPIRYLSPGDEVGQILDGLLELSREGFQNRFIQESQKSAPISWIDWSEEEMLDWMTDYYNEIVDYYQSAVRQQKALLLYLT
ncbi:MAG: DUF1877 family protein [Nostoc sp.]|uniref:DUF1877 family protein n=1 Tax=Nostoc sp. TaxID=1180 RepID=UPI002FF67DE6